jgi:hypothetical protein
VALTAALQAVDGVAQAFTGCMADFAARTSDFRLRTSDFRPLAFQQPAGAPREADRRTPVESSAP